MAEQKNRITLNAERYTQGYMLHAFGVINTACKIYPAPAGSFYLFVLSLKLKIKFENQFAVGILKKNTAKAVNSDKFIFWHSS